MKLEKSLAAAMNATIVGSGEEALILAHGFGGDRSIWDDIVPSLAQRFRVLVFDWSFSGAVKEKNLLDRASKHAASFEAYADELISLVDEIGFGPSALVGHSMSGMIGCIASVRRPELFKRLILVGASPRYINSDEYEGGLDALAVEEIISSIDTNFTLWASAFASFVVDANHPLAVDKFEKSLKRMRPQITLSLAKTIFYGDNRGILEKVLTPCTIVQTTDDGVVPVSVAHYMKTKIKGDSTVEMIDTPGHFPQLTAPDQLLAVLKRVLASSS